MGDTENTLREAAERARKAQSTETTTYVTDTPGGRVDESSTLHAPSYHATRDDVSRSKYVKTLCGRDITVNTSSDARPSRVCDACDSVLESEQDPR